MPKTINVHEFPPEVPDPEPSDSIQEEPIIKLLLNINYLIIVMLNKYKYKIIKMYNYIKKYLLKVQ